MTVEDRSDFYKKYELNRIQLWRYVYENYLKTHFIPHLPDAKAIADTVVNEYDATFK